MVGIVDRHGSRIVATAMTGLWFSAPSFGWLRRYVETHTMCESKGKEHVCFLDFLRYFVYLY